jgi:hypothetical protein
VSRQVTLVGYALLAAGLVALQLVALVSALVPTLGQVVTRVMRWRAGRWALVAAWLWVGWHVFVRSDWR